MSGLTEQDQRALEALANGDLSAFNEAAGSNEEAEQQEFNVRADQVYAASKLKAVTALIRAVNPNNFFDIERPLQDQSLAAFVGAIVGALSAAFDSGAETVAHIAVSEHNKHHGHKHDE